MGAFRDYLDSEISFILLSEGKDDMFSIWPRANGASGYIAGSHKRWQQVHDLPTVKPRKEGSLFSGRVRKYTNSSETINRELMYKADGWLHTPITKSTLSKANGMSKAFTKDTTNQTPLVTYSGVSKDLGDKLGAAPNGSFHHLAAFTSTTTDKRTAHGFATKKVWGKTHPHIIRFHLKPGTGLSAAHHSDYNENEVILDKGTKIEKVKSEVKTLSHGGKVWVHHVVAHPEKLSVDQYKTREDEHHNAGLISK